MHWRAINIFFLLTRPCDLSLPCSCLALVGLEVIFGICQLPGKHQDPVANKSFRDAKQHFEHIWWCRRVFYSFPAFKKCLKGNIIFKLSRYFKLAKPLYLSTFVPPVQTSPPVDLQFPVTITRLQQVEVHLLHPSNLFLDLSQKGSFDIV